MASIWGAFRCLTMTGTPRCLQSVGFGGQDIYLGTHSLFLDERAVYVIVWTPEHENTDAFEENGVPMQNLPLVYWLEYVRSLAGADAPVIVVHRTVTESATSRKRQCLTRMVLLACDARRAAPNNAMAWSAFSRNSKPPPACCKSAMAPSGCRKLGETSLTSCARNAMPGKNPQLVGLC